MRTRSHEIIRHLPELRRYAHALLGSRQSGDGQLRIMLEALLQSPGELDSRRELRLELFRFFHDVVHALQLPFERPAEGGAPTEQRLREAVAALPLHNREALLLTSLTGFDAVQVGEILGISKPGVERVLAATRDQIRHVREAHPRRGGVRRAASRGAACRRVTARDIGDAITDALAAPTVVKAHVLRG